MRNGALWEKKDKNVDENTDDKNKVGSKWDHVAIDANSRLVVSYVCGNRTKEESLALLNDFSLRCNRGHPSNSRGLPPRKIRTDDYSVYKDAILHTYGAKVISDDPDENGTYIAPFGFVYTVIRKTRKNGRIVYVDRDIRLGLEYLDYKGLDASEYLDGAYTNIIERYNGTDRHLNSRKRRKTYEFSKDISYHKSSSWLSIGYYNFAWDHRNLRLRIDNHFCRYLHRSPAVSSGITSHIWSINEFVTYQVIDWIQIFSDT